MLLSQAKIRGFRNFKDATINFSEKSLIIGPNDVGKTNLIYALRILLDKSLSESDIEPKDSDFYVYDETNEFTILLKFNDVLEDSLRSKFREYVSDDDELFLSFKAIRDPVTKSIDYQYYAGFDENNLEEITSRFYLKVLNLKYISSSRNLSSFIKKEKKNLFSETKKERTEDEIKKDEANLKEIKTHLDKINTKIPELAYIKNSTRVVNEELEKLSFRNTTHKVIFDVGTEDPSKIVDNVRLTAKYNDERIEVGGDGKNNQIFFALWAAKNEIKRDDQFEVSIYCIEEPEVHLHPHQQRKLAEYISTVLNGQILLTSHSPQILAKFSPNSIIRLHFDKSETLAANDGCSEIIESSFIKFGHRLSIIPAEAFFADVVFLVEGSSEVMFYTALADSLVNNIDLDRNNISILSVEGVGFRIYIQILDNLKINWVLRTDNDIFKVKGKEQYYFAGVSRCLNAYNEYKNGSGFLDDVIVNKKDWIYIKSETPSPIEFDKIKKVNDCLLEHNLFLAGKDLENDLYNSEIKPDLEDYYKDDSSSDIVKKMQKNKSTFMYDFLSEYSESLSKLEDNTLSLPLKKCKEIAEKIERI